MPVRSARDRSLHQLTASSKLIQKSQRPVETDVGRAIGGVCPDLNASGSAEHLCIKSLAAQAIGSKCKRAIDRIQPEDFALQGVICQPDPAAYINRSTFPVQRDQQFKRQSGDAIGWIGDATSGWKTIIGAGTGSDVLSFDEPGDVFVAGGYIYVADRQNHRVSRWGLNGMSAGWIGGGSNGW